MSDRPSDLAAPTGSDHPSDRAIEDYVGEVLDPAQRGALEDHVRACTSCRARLARAAEAELALLTLASEPPPARRPVFRRSARAAAIGVAVAIAAAAAVIALVRERPSAQDDQ